MIVRFNILVEVAFLGAVLLVAGCASLSKDECITADWQTIGYEDGLNGSHRNRIGAHREACAKHGVTPDRIAYDQGLQEGVRDFCTYERGLQVGQNGETVPSVCPIDSEFRLGHAEGLETYCTYEVGYQKGLGGQRYNNVCPKNRVDDFLAGYDLGKHIHDLQVTLRQLGSDLDNVLEDQEQNEIDIEETKAEIAYNENLTSDQRRRLLEQLEEYNELTVVLENRHIGIEIDIERIRRELAELNTR